MTTLLTITTAVLAVCAVALGWRCVRLRKELKAQASYAHALYCNLKSVETDRYDYIYLCNIVPDSFGGYFIIKERGCGVSVCKKYGDKYCVIKEFIDPDASFNQREAEELLDKLNEK